MPDEAEAIGLLALMLLQRLAPRPRGWTPTGDLVLLADQDRSLLGPRADRRGRAARRAGLAARPARASYLLQASIAVEHARGSDWTRIAWLYDELLADLADADRGAQPRRRDRRARRPAGRARPRWTRSATSTPTTSSTPPAPTCCAAWTARRGGRGRL